MSNIILFGRLITEFRGDYRKELKNILQEIVNSDFKINEWIKKGNKKKLIDDFVWRFGGVKNGSINNKEYIYGKLGKISSKVELAFDENKKDYIESKATKAYVMHFLIDLEKKVIAYESKKDIGEKTPLDLFEELVRLKSNGDLFLDIKTITDKELITNRIKSFSSLKEIDFNVYRTNPDSTSGSDEMDKFLREGHIKKLKIKATGDETGIKLDKLSLFKSGFHLAEEGYGSAKATGKINNKKEIFSFGKIPYKTKVDITNNDEVNITKLIHQIKEALNKLEAIKNTKK